MRSTLTTIFVAAILVISLTGIAMWRVDSWDACRRFGHTRVFCVLEPF